MILFKRITFDGRRGNKDDRLSPDDVHVRMG